MERRVECVLCDCKILEPFYTLSNFPILYSATENSPSEDIFLHTEFKICKECRCVQLVNLVDKNFLYSHDNTIFKREFWINHHKAFISFLENSIPVTSICEFGGGSHPLFDYFTQKPSSYSMIDIFEPNLRTDGIDYKKGECETYTDYTEDIVIMSHTFEHLYNPKDFLRNASQSKIKYIFLSIPFYECYLKNNSSFVFINAQHTFYYEKKSIESFFAKYGFALHSFQDYKDHSLFFGFAKADSHISLQPMTLEKDLYLHFHKKIESIQSITLNVPFYIMPSFTYGQFAYHFLKNKSYAIGFLDNNERIAKKRIYGTPLLSYLPSILEDSSCKNVLLIKTPYYNEMFTQLSSLYPDVMIHTLEI